MKDVRYGYGIFFPVTIFAGVLTTIAFAAAAGIASDPAKYSQSAPIMANVAPVLAGILIAIMIGGIVSYVSLHQTETAVENRMENLIEELRQKSEKEIDGWKRSLETKERDIDAERQKWLRQMIQWVGITLDDPGWMWILKQVSEKPTTSEYLSAFQAQMAGVVVAMRKIHELDTQKIAYGPIYSRILCDLTRATENTKHTGAEPNAAKDWQTFVDEIKKVLPEPPKPVQL